MTGPSAQPSSAFFLGRLTLAADIPRPDDRDALGALVRQPRLGSARANHDAPRDGALRMADAATLSDWPSVAQDALRVEHTNGQCTVTTEALRGAITTSPTWTIDIAVRRRDLSPDAFRTHLSIVVHRLLLEASCAYLHAAAVEWDDRVLLFVGEKGAGKSTISLALGRAGATILGDDHVLIERIGPAFVASGCESTSRVTAETEAYVFGESLAVDAQDYAGTLKKEFEISSHFRATPFVAKPIAALYFPRVGSQLKVSAKPRPQALLDMVQRTRASFRPQNGDEMDELLSFWSALVRQADTFDLELPRDLRALAPLADALRR